MDMHRVRYICCTNDRVNEIPFLCGTDLRVLAGSTLTERIVPVYVEIETIVIEERPHSLSCDAFGCCAFVLEILLCAVFGDSR